MKKLIIDRVTWLRGEGAGESRLVRPVDDKKCCLGFYGLACGIERDSMSNRSAFVEIDDGCDFPIEMQWLLDKSKTLPDMIENSEIAGRLMETNDNKGITDETRERVIRHVFLKNGVEVEFIN